MSTQNKHLSKARREQQIITAADVILREVGANNFTVDQIVEHGANRKNRDKSVPILGQVP